MSSPSAANTCLPETSPVVISTPPIPSASRGIRCPLDGNAGRLNKGKPILAYPSGKLVVTRTLDDTALLPAVSDKLSSLCYRGHAYSVTACKLAPSGAYMASGDERGAIRVWAFDHPEHLSKYEQQGLNGAFRDIDWDSESKRLVLGGERSDSRSECAKTIQWDGVTGGSLMQFTKGRVAAVAFKPNRPFRIATAGMDEPKCYFHQGPPFKHIASVDSVPCESAHTRGGVQCIRYSSDGAFLVTVGTDRSICLYDGKTMELKSKIDNIHTATVYSCAFSGNDKSILTASGDGTCKLFSLDASSATMQEEKTWEVAKEQLGDTFDKVPVGGVQLGCTFVNGDIPVSVGFNCNLCILGKPGTSDKMKFITGHSAPIDSFSVDEARGVFYTGDTDGIVCKWDLKSVKPLNRISHNKDDLMCILHGNAEKPAAVSGVSVVPGTGSVLTAGWDDNLNVTSDKGAIAGPRSLGAQPQCIASGKDLSVIVTHKGLILVKGGKPGSLQSIPYEAKSACISSDDKTVYVGGMDNNIHVYTTDGSSITEKTVISEKHLKPIHSLALSPDGSMLASGDEKDICVFKTSDYSSVIGRGRWCFHLQRITCLTWSKDGTILASGGADDNIYLWSLEKNMRRVHYPFAHRGGLTGLHFLQNSSKLELLSVGMDSVVNQWDVTADVAAKFE